MAIRFIDTSVFVRAYMSDEARNDEAMSILIGRDRLVASALLGVESVAAIRAAQRSGRVPQSVADDVLAAIEDDTSSSGVVELIPLDGLTTLERARQIVFDHPVRTLGAVHLAVAVREGRLLAEPDEELVFTTFDDRQRDAARALGLSVG
jgi:predicted nucleic acid-binding protein